MIENPSYELENILKRFVKNMRKNQFLKVMNNLLELEKDFIKMKDIDLLDREVKIKGELEELFFKAIIVSIDDMDKFF